MEAGARSADAGGFVALLNPLFANLAPGSFAQAFERSGVTPTALASGYAAFFIYTCVVGVAAVVLAIVIARGLTPDRAAG